MVNTPQAATFGWLRGGRGLSQRGARGEAAQGRGHFPTCCSARGVPSPALPSPALPSPAPRRLEVAVHRRLEVAVQESAPPHTAAGGRASKAPWGQAAGEGGGW